MSDCHIYIIPCEKEEGILDLLCDRGAGCMSKGSGYCHFRRFLTRSGLIVHVALYRLPVPRDSFCSSVVKNLLCSGCLRWHLHSVIFQGHNNKSVSDLAHNRVIVVHLLSLKASISAPFCLFFIQLQSDCCVENLCWGFKMLKWLFPHH